MNEGRAHSSSGVFGPPETKWTCLASGPPTLLTPCVCACFRFLTFQGTTAGNTHHCESDSLCESKCNGWEATFCFLDAGEEGLGVCAEAQASRMGFKPRPAPPAGLSSSHPEEAPGSPCPAAQAVARGSRIRQASYLGSAPKCLVTPGQASSFPRACVPIKRDEPSPFSSQPLGFLVRD